jgi:hypothetical protein
MNEEDIIAHLHRILNDDDLRLSFQQKEAIAGAIEIIKKKGLLNPEWAEILLKALGIGIKIFDESP